jgi:hypothetical protein
MRQPEIKFYALSEMSFQQGRSNIRGSFRVILTVS